MFPDFVAIARVYKVFPSVPFCLLSITWRVADRLDSEIYWALDYSAQYSNPGTNSVASPNQRKGLMTRVALAVDVGPILAQMIVVLPIELHA
jgi:hypothetical protein